MKSKDLIWREAAAPPGNVVKSSIVRTPGVGNSSGASGPASSSTFGKREVAFSTFAAYPQFEQLAIKSSPASVLATNSLDSDPPIAPEEASTIEKSMPQRVKILWYASR